MPIKEKVYHSQLTGDIDEFLSSKKKDNTSDSGKSEGDVEFLNVLEFIDRFKLLPHGLFPVQRFIVKLYYNIPLDDKEKIIKVTDKFGVKTLFTFTEVEYLAFLYDQGRCNIKVQDGKDRRELLLCLGRRSGKSSLSALFSAYELYKLLCRGNPQSFYGMPFGSEIRILCVANDKEQASIVYGDMQSHVESVDYFKNSIANTTQTFMKFRTEQDRKKFGTEGKASLTATFKSSIAKGLRGRGIILTVLDEIAFFIDNGRSSAERVYRAVVPSLAQFSPKDPANKHVPIGPSDGRMILISSPDAREGFFFNQYQLGMSNDKGAANMLIIQAPTWEVNPTLSHEYYEVEYHKDPRSFMTEHGAEFSDRVRGWIEDSKDLTDCVIPELRPITHGVPREMHFAGVDFGIQNDGTAIAIVRIRGGKVELVYHEIWYAKKRWREINPHLESPIISYAMNLESVHRLDIDEIAEWFSVLSKRFFIHKAIFDQYAGPVFEQILHKKGLRQFEMRNFFAADSSHMYQNFKMHMFNKQIVLYDWPIPDTSGEAGQLRHSPLIAELLELQSTSGGKNMISVEAPKVPGKHDDMSDALGRAILLASEYIHDNPGITSTQGLDIGSNRVALGSYNSYHRQRSRLHGGNQRFMPRVRAR